MHVYATVAPSSHELGCEYVLSVILTNFRADNDEIVDRDILVNHVSIRASFQPGVVNF